MVNKSQKIWDTAPDHPHGLVSTGKCFLQHLQTRSCSASTYRSRRYYLSMFFTWCDQCDITRIDQVDRTVIDHYHRHLCRCYSKKCQGLLSDNSRRLHLMVLALFFRWLVSTQRLLFDPTGHIDMPRQPRHLPRLVLTQQQAEAIINQPDIQTVTGIRDRAILETFYSTGIRGGEMIHLNVGDIDLARGMLLVIQGKGKKDRLIPVGERAIGWIEKYLSQARGQLLARNLHQRSEALFLTQYGRAFRSTTSLSPTIRHYVRAAGITEGACHLFRRTMATLMLENGADIRFIQEILGHQNLQTTEIYTRVNIGKLKQVHALTHPVEFFYD